jgi:glycine/serine hydroxymethyltransferase
MPQTWTTTIKIQGVPVRVSGTHAHVMAAVCNALRRAKQDASRAERKPPPGLVQYCKSKAG